MRRPSSAAAPAAVPPIIHEVLRSPGQPLDAATRSFMEPRFGRDFSAVKVHTDSRAAESAGAVNALAYTVGPHVVFGLGQYAPGTSSGRRLMAHELTHTVQQSRGGIATLAGLLRVSNPGDADEHEAEAVAASVVTASEPGASASDIKPATPAIQRIGDLSKVPPGLESECEIASDSPGMTVENLMFGNRSSTLSAAEESKLERFVLGWTAAGGTAPVRVDGYASTTGSDELNWRLSCDRAKVVASKLITPSSGVAGIPVAFIRTVAQSETTEFGAPAGNRMVTISSPMSMPPVPVPVPAPVPTPAAPAGPVCGPDVTGEISAAVSNTKSTFAGWNAAKRESQCDALDSLSTGAMAWDILELHNNDWIHRVYRPACASAGATPPCGSTVQVETDCHYAGSPNYVIYGVMCKLCNDHFTAVGNANGAARFTEAEMLSWINFYKGTGWHGAGTPAGNFAASNNWAVAGYNGWAGSGGPAGDRNTCSPACPTAYAGGAFNVHWFPEVF
ncbi:MAG: DUF4157 domain-containing protein [Verrucomicrobia bacterium]|nr:DUF4157 domain-containing protein [Verrucomicrobiota bacterium]